MVATTRSPGTRRRFGRGTVAIIPAAAGAVLLGGALTACTSSSSSPGTSSAATTVKTASNPSLGTILVNSSGMTLYRFDADSASPPASHCTGGCAGVWPPVTAGSAASVAQGFAQSELGTLTRSDGTKQVTVDGWPVYTYTGDSSAGQANGERLNVNGGVWWAVTPGGARATPSPGAPSSSAGVKY